MLTWLLLMFGPMGSEAEALQRKQHFGSFQVTQDLMAEPPQMRCSCIACPRIAEVWQT